VARPDGVRVDTDLVMTTEKRSGRAGSEGSLDGDLLGISGEAVGQVDGPGFFAVVNAHHDAGVAGGMVVGVVEHQKAGSKLRDGNGAAAEEEGDLDVGGVAEVAAGLVIDA